MPSWNPFIATGFEVLHPVYLVYHSPTFVAWRTQYAMTAAPSCAMYGHGSWYIPKGGPRAIAQNLVKFCPVVLVRPVTTTPGHREKELTPVDASRRASSA